MINEEKTPVYKPVNEQLPQAVSLDIIDEEKTIFLDEDDSSLLVKNLNTKEEFEFTSFPVSLGRADDADIVLSGKSVSRKHAVIEKTENDQLVIKDLGSTNGIKIGGKKTPQLLIIDNTVIDIGEYKLQLSFEGLDDIDYPTTPANLKKGLHSLPKKPLIISGLALLALLVGSFAVVKNKSNRDTVTQTAQTIDESAGVDTDTETPSLDNDVEINTATLPDNNVSAQVANSTLSDDTLSTAALLNTAAEQAPVENQLTSLDQEDSTVVTENPKPAPIRRSSAWSRDYINTSINYYLDGNASEATRRLGILSRSSRHQAQFREQAASLQAELNSIFNIYNQAQTLMSQQNTEQALSYFRQFQEQERSKSYSRNSAYYQLADQRVQELSIPFAQTQASQPENWLQDEGKKIYLEGYRLEHTNTEMAKLKWAQVLEILPSESEYHQKAKAKLRLYEHIKNK